MRFALLLCLALAAGCTVEEVDPAPDGSAAEALPDDGRTEAEREALGAATGSRDVVTTESPGDDAPLADAAVYRLRRIVLGDAACTLDLQAADGEAEMRLADFGVCSQAEVENLIGQEVRIELGTGQVMAASCQGDPECPETERVELVTRLFAAE